MSGDRAPGRPERPREARRARTGPLSEQLLGGVSRAAWRSVTWPLEVSRLLLPASATGAGAASWSARWLEATKWWTEALGAGALLGPDGNSRLLLELTTGLGRAFRGRRVDVEVRGRRIRAELDSISLEYTQGRYHGRLELRAIDYGGLEADALSVIAGEVALTTQPNVALIVTGVELRGRAALTPAVAWLDRELSEWSLCVAEDDLIQATPRRGGRRFLVDAVIRNGQLDVELRALGLRGLTLRCPRWLRLTRKLELPALPEGMLVVDARHRGAGVEFQVSIASLTQPFDLGRAREAIFWAAAARYR